MLKDAIGRDVKGGDIIVHVNRRGSRLYYRMGMVVEVGTDYVKWRAGHGNKHMRYDEEKKAWEWYETEPKVTTLTASNFVKIN